MKKKKKRGVKGKLTIAFIVMGVLLSLGVGIGVYSVSYRQVSAQYTERAFSYAKTAALLVDGDSIAGFLENGKDDEYFATYSALYDFRKAVGLTFLYVLSHKTDDQTAVVYVFDVYIEGDDPELVGDLNEEISDSDFAAADIASQTYYSGRIEDSAVVSITGYGWLASAYVPVLASDGTVTAILGVDISMNRIMAEIILQTLQILLITIAIIVLFLFILRFIVGKQILDPVMRLSQHMDSFNPEDGKLDIIDIRESGDEFQTIAESFNRMVGDIRYYMENLAAVTAERERIATELNVATEIQASMLPYVFPAFPERIEFDIYATMHPAREVGGDFYDFFLIDKDTLAVVIADVSDKGIPAALFMVIAKTHIKNDAMDGKSPKEVFESVNNKLCENNDAGMFVTAFMGYLDIPSGRFTYVNAGHNPPLIKRGGEFGFMNLDPGLMLAVMEGLEYVQGEIVLSSGDMLYLYTDGITEAMDTGKYLFTNKRLLEKAHLYNDCSANEILFKIKEEIDAFAEGAEQADDITMLALEIK